MRKTFLILASLPLLLSAQLQSPSTFLGYELGAKFSRHHEVVDYFQHVAEEKAANVLLQEYGRTYENRSLNLAFISSADNIKQIEKIRTDNLKRAGLLSGTPETEVNIVWLSYNVHGNESVSTEASMATIYELLKDDTKSEWLANTLVIIDPCINPDGRERYVQFYWQYGAQPYNAFPEAVEHNEPWPGGRANHYLFDLNRDWAWQTQVESQQRLKVYNKWLPQIHVDFHEQGVNAPYYFAPAAEPFHELITPFQRAFQETIGRNHAKYFDQNNWFYFTKQVFDLLYPSYGDTYPTFNGAIGMTYEQGGSGRAGLGVIKQEGDTLTLKDRIAHHFTTGISTIEVASQNADALLQNFTKFFGDNSSLKYKTFIIKSDGKEDKISQLQNWLTNQGIQFGKVEEETKISAEDYFSGKELSIRVAPEDLVISMDQPKATLAHILFEPKTKLVDSLTYDITAWGIPYAYGLNAFASSKKLSIEIPKENYPGEMATPESAYAFISKWDDMKDARFVAALWKNSIKVRVSQKPIAIGGNAFSRGSVIIAKRDNKQVKDFEKTVTDLANTHSRFLGVSQTGFSEKGPDLGSGDVVYQPAPKIALLSGEGTSSLAAGATWHFMEQDLGYPVTLLGTDYFGRVDLAKFDVLILQNGWYSNFKDREIEKIIAWVRAGGKVIAVQSALEIFKDKKFGSLSAYKNEEEKKSAEKAKVERSKEAQLISYDQQERNFVKGFTPGAIFKVKLDQTHPLAFGYDSEYYTLKTTVAKNAYLKGNNVGIIAGENSLMSGFAGQYAKEDLANSLVFGVDRVGKGEIIYMVDNPLFRSFWENGKLLFVNAIFW